MDTGYRIEVDREFIANATDELFLCLLAQNLAYIDRFYSGGFAVRLKSILRVAGLCLSLLGVLLCVVIALLIPDGCPVWFELKVYLPLFAVCVLIFYFLPGLDRSAHRWTERNARRNCQRRANRCMSQLHRLVPVTVDYDIKGDLITCFRCKGDHSMLAWSKRLTGVAFQGDRITAIFRKSTSLQPHIIILHRDGVVLRQVLHELTVEIKPIPNQQAGAGF
jgi:hypothetical protein